MKHESIMDDSNAVKYFMASVKIYEAFLKDRPLAAITSLKLAWMCREMGEFENAVEMLEKLLSIQVANLEDHPETAITCKELGLLFREMGYYDDSMNMLQIVEHSKNCTWRSP